MLPLLLLGLMVAVAAFVFLFRPNSVDDATRQAQEESATAVGDATQWGSGESVNKRRPGADRTADGVGAGADRGPEALGAADRGSEAAEAASDFARGAADGASTTGQRGQSGVGAAAEPAPMTLTLPNGAKVDVAAGSIGYELATFLANGDAGGLPKSFTFDHLNFDTGTTRLTADSKNTVEALAAILKAYPGAEVRLEGHTDDAGNPASNQRLSDARAQAVKARLSALGATNRMSASGYGQERPKAPNDTPEGRAENRRLELVVLKK